jgi:hypothetical protein
MYTSKKAQIKNQLDFLIYKYRFGDTGYENVYANGNGAMYYSIPSFQKEFDKHYVILIKDNFQAFRSNPLMDNIEWQNGNNILVVGNSKEEFSQIEDFYFARPHLNRSNSLSFLNDAGQDSNFEFNEHFQKQPAYGRSPMQNYVNKMKELPNGLRIEYQYKAPLVNIMYDRKDKPVIEGEDEKPVIENVKSIQKLDKNSCVIFVGNDLYIIDWDAKPEQYADVLLQFKAPRTNQKLIKEYLKRYMNIVNIMLSNENYSK